MFETVFDSTYPIRLNGIIGQDEFRQSIANITNVRFRDIRCFISLW